MDHAYEQGVIIVAAGGQIVDQVCYPAKYDRTIAVGGIKADRTVWFHYGQAGDAIDVWAPAFEVPRADGFPEPGQIPAEPDEPEDPGSSSGSGSLGSNSGSLGKGAGTSFATVHVAAAAAMWLRHRGEEIERKYSEPWQRVEAFRHQLRHARTPLNEPPRRAPANGTGLLDIERVLVKQLPEPAALAKAPADAGKLA